VATRQQQIPKGNRPLISSYSVRTRQGWIPGQKKVNQDSFIIEKNFANLKDLWMLGVCDGHGAQGHLVSNYVKVNLPKTLTEKISQLQGALKLMDHQQQ